MQYKHFITILNSASLKLVNRQMYYICIYARRRKYIHKHTTWLHFRSRQYELVITLQWGRYIYWTVSISADPRIYRCRIETFSLWTVLIIDMVKKVIHSFIITILFNSCVHRYGLGVERCFGWQKLQSSRQPLLTLQLSVSWHTGIQTLATDAEDKYNNNRPICCYKIPVLCHIHVQTSILCVH